MTDIAAVSVVCYGRALRDPETGAPSTARSHQTSPEVIYRCAVRPGETPSGFELSGRVLVGGEVLPGDSRAAKWGALWKAAVSTGRLPRVARQLECPACHQTWRARRCTAPIHIRTIGGIDSPFIQSINFRRRQIRRPQRG